MELRSTLYIKLGNTEQQSALFTMLKDGEIYSAVLKELVGDNNAQHVDVLFEQAEDDAFYIEQPSKENGYIVAEMVARNGSEASLPPLVDFFYNVYPECDVRIKGAGEESYMVFIRRDEGATQMRVWEEGDPEELMENQQWFNEGLPPELQSEDIDFDFF